MQTLVIGDIHGCYEEIQALLEKAGLTEGDAIVSVGDCVDRGPDTPAVLEFFQKTPNALLIMGNHERKHVRAGRHEVKLAQSQKISRIQFGETYPDVLVFMNTLPLYLDLPEALGYMDILNRVFPCCNSVQRYCAEQWAGTNTFVQHMTVPGMNCMMVRSHCL